MVVGRWSLASDEICRDSRTTNDYRPTTVSQVRFVSGHAFRRAANATLWPRL